MRLLMTVVAAVALLAGCRDAADRPLEPVWGKQPCDHCAMLVDEPRFAAQAATADGTHVYFDDVGCLAAWLGEHPAAGTRAWVRNEAGWTPAGDAHFSAGAHTPMGYGFVAAADGKSWSDVQRDVQRAIASREAPHAQ